MEVVIDGYSSTNIQKPPPPPPPPIAVTHFNYNDFVIKKVYCLNGKNYFHWSQLIC